MRTINSTFEARRFKIYILKRLLRKTWGKEEKENNEIGLHKKFY